MCPLIVEVILKSLFPPVLGSVGFLVCNSVVGVGDDLKRRRRKDGHSDSKIRRWMPSSTPVASHVGNYLLIIYQTSRQSFSPKGSLLRGGFKLTFISGSVGIGYYSFRECMLRCLLYSLYFQEEEEEEHLKMLTTLVPLAAECWHRERRQGGGLGSLRGGGRSPAKRGRRVQGGSWRL